MAKPRKIILDTDPGIDDILAVFLAHTSPEVELLGVTTVAGNCKVKEGCNNLVAARSVIGQGAFPIYKGAWRPLVRPLRTQADIYGKDEAIGIPFDPGYRVELAPGKAVDFLIEQVNALPGEITLFPLGPLTNIALAIILDPNFAGNVKEIFLMGGAARVPGNTWPTVEFNFFVDPEAAQVVFESGIPLTMTGLDVTGKTALYPADAQRLLDADTSVSRFVHAITRHYHDRNRPCYLFDPLAVAVGIDPSLITRSELLHVAIETQGTWTAGSTLVDWDGRMMGGRQNARVCLEVDSEAFNAMFWQRVIYSL